MPIWLETSITIITGLVMLLGLLGLIVPIFPGLVIIWLAALAFALIKISAMTTVSWLLFGIITILAVVGSLADNVLMGAKALEYGASKRSIFLTLVIAVGVSLFLSPIGGLISAPFALYFLEKGNGRTKEEAMNITKGLMTGWGWAFVVRFGLGMVMIVLWLFII
jgi:uncharacterized protein YqgC (DUF456 family)